ARGLFSTDYALAITGIAGPGPGGAKGALGTVYIALAGPSGVLVKKFSFGQPRERVIKKTVNKALEILLRQISKN
ncbi:MAG: CinA family protein, partial [Marinirhabdus sp.]